MWALPIYPPILPDESALIMQVVLKIGLLQWQIVLGDISKSFYKPLVWMAYKTGNTVQYLFYYIFLKKNCILPVIQAEFVFIYCVRECISDNVCSLIKLHPFSAKVFLVAIVCPDFFKLMGLLLRKGKVDDVSDHLCEHYIVLKDKCG